MSWVNLDSLRTLCALFHRGLLELGLHLEMIELTRLHGLGGDDLVDERTIPHGRCQPLVSPSKFFIHAWSLNWAYCFKDSIFVPRCQNDRESYPALGHAASFSSGSWRPLEQ